MSHSELRQRLSAILAADACGYSRLMAADAPATVRMLDEARQVFRAQTESHQGRIIDMAGDSVLAVFDTATGAAAAALEVQRLLAERFAPVPDERRMRFRIGIHLGDVFEKDDGTVYGDGVNIAARLEGLAEPGGITISESVQIAVRSHVVAVFDDQGEQAVKNIPQPVHAYRMAAVPRPSAPGPKPATPAIYAKPAIAVLPFDNLSGDPEQTYFSDGLTEDIITGLAAWRSFPVIARNSSFAYKGSSPDVRKVAQELGARYVLEGSVRKSGGRVRVTAQLIDGSSGSHLWAERFDRDFHDLFAVQDEITARIVSSIEPELSSAEIRQVAKRPPESFTAWDLYVRGLAAMADYGRNRAATKAFFERALAEDANSVDAATALALCHSADVYAARAADVEGSIAAMFALAQRALAVDARHFRIHVVLCLAHFWRGDMNKAVEAGRKAVALNPSSAEAHESLATALCHLGIAQEAEDNARIALRLTPIDPRLHRFQFGLAQALLGQRRFDEAHAELMKALGARPHDVVLLGYRTVLLGHLGRVDEAKACLAEYLSKRGFRTADDYRRHYVRNSALTELNLEGLRKAGWEV